MNDAYDCEYDMVENPTEMLEQAHARIRELEAEHASEIERLRLTDEEREAVEVAIRCVDSVRSWKAPQDALREKMTEHAATLRGLLERLG